MFTGLIEALGKVVGKNEVNGNLILSIQCPFLEELEINQSITHNGACLSISSIEADHYKVTLIDETLKKTCLGELQIGDYVNLERSMPSSGRFDGHIVQGHVDKVGTCVEVKEEKGSKIFTFEYIEDQFSVTVEKGSICVNGISLTVLNSLTNRFSVAIIPYTLNHTNLQFVKVGSKVNLEFDIVGKYISKILLLKK